MNRNLERFHTDLNDFQGEGLEIAERATQPTPDFLPIGTRVTIGQVDGTIEIDTVLPVYEKQLYHYKGIIQTNEGKQYIYFQHHHITALVDK